MRRAGGHPTGPPRRCAAQRRRTLVVAAPASQGRLRARTRTRPPCGSCPARRNGTADGARRRRLRRCARPQTRAATVAAAAARAPAAPAAPVAPVAVADAAVPARRLARGVGTSSLDYTKRRRIGAWAEPVWPYPPGRLALSLLRDRWVPPTISRRSLGADAPQQGALNHDPTLRFWGVVSRTDFVRFASPDDLSTRRALTLAGFSQ